MLWHKRAQTQTETPRLVMEEDDTDLDISHDTKQPRASATCFSSTSPLGASTSTAKVRPKCFALQGSTPPRPISYLACAADYASEPPSMLQLRRAKANMVPLLQARQTTDASHRW